MKIKNIEIQGHVILGPMAGVTTLAYRDFMKPFGVGLSYSEMISDCGIDYCISFDVSKCESGI